MEKPQDSVFFVFAHIQSEKFVTAYFGRCTHGYIRGKLIAGMPLERKIATALWSIIELNLTPSVFVEISIDCDGESFEWDYDEMIGKGKEFGILVEADGELNVNISSAIDKEEKAEAKKEEKSPELKRMKVEWG